MWADNSNTKDMIAKFLEAMFSYEIFWRYKDREICQSTLPNIEATFV